MVKTMYDGVRERLVPWFSLKNKEMREVWKSGKEPLVITASDAAKKVAPAKPLAQPITFCVEVEGAEEYTLPTIREAWRMMREVIDAQKEARRQGIEGITAIVVRVYRVVGEGDARKYWLIGEYQEQAEEQRVEEEVGGDDTNTVAGC